MKQKLMLMLAVLAVVSLHAQDTIVFHNGNEVVAKVKELTETQIKYILWANPSGPTYTKDLSSIREVKYHNGYVEVYDAAKEGGRDKSDTGNCSLSTIQGVLYATYETAQGDSYYANSVRLSEKEIYSLLGYDRADTYFSAKRQCNWGGFLAGTGIGALIGAIGGLIIDGEITTISGLCLMYADVTIPLGFVLYGVGKGRISRVVEGFNANSQMADNLSLSVKPTLLAMPEPLGGGVALGAGIGLRF